jgi:hypothetical protein
MVGKHTPSLALLVHLHSSIGIGCVLGSLVTGKLMDRDYARELAQYREERDIPKDLDLKQQDLPDFPIERARLRSIYVLNAIFVLSTAWYGQAVEWHIAIPLTLQFLGRQQIQADQ